LTNLGGKTLLIGERGFSARKKWGRDKKKKKVWNKSPGRKGVGGKIWGGKELGVRGPS